MTEKNTILVVEDDGGVRDVLIDLLKNAGYGCTGSASCAEAREAVRDNQFACALIDLGLPDGNGLALLPEFKEIDPGLVPIILTGDGRAETIVETMRAGAFDYLNKPVQRAMLQAAVARAIEHNEAIRERDRLVLLLSREREQLQIRVEEATADIRQYAADCEIINTRLQALLRLTRLSADLYTDERLFRSVFEELAKYMPIQCVALCGCLQNEFLAALRGDDGETAVIVSEGAAAGPGQDPLPDCRELKSAPRIWVERHTDLDVSHLATFVYPQTFWGHAVCTVVFFLSPGYEADEACDEFLSMCAHFVAFEWQEARLFLHATQHASLGNIALALSKSFIQGLTAIRTTADFVKETTVSSEAADGLGIICDNVESLQRQIQEFRQLASLRKDSVETVCLDEYIDEAIEMLSVAIQGRDIKIDKDYRSRGECVLLNGTTLARTFLDLISGAVRTVEAGGRILLRLMDAQTDFIVFEISHDVVDPQVLGLAGWGGGRSLPDLIESHPRFFLAQRTIQSCGGKLILEHEREGRCTFRIVLPKNAMNPSGLPEV